ncbi:CRISPR-associated endoribonuclease Cas6 (plasmid) [Clostridium botulinum]|uniref:CRISPR-associated protein Cas6 C-terminal domain-containing protein n=1 Tax=Clostridium botulinum C/D str. DC5 TaxID=1443128 RepID=A0A0A0HWW2_CLOBO|nr:CRISPR-associated endoribonuclease Cas6 [Clostridium botulinum]KGM92899.1 hypothetical protein Z956_13235 [Clostridium botulinum D str. CCUG 7971]KGM93042.1 hypothetical protein Z955_16065 [Clostridium botulinum C/D str. DC5]KOC47196.1 hypothetical protein ADU88_10855 [Clostridium botulinum]KOC51510.1 hypothetical protein ADU89_13345 [Clostridium botulinum]KOC56024.1 hypothetical protein ADU90_09195 [Clostridium botulinum]
MLSCYTVYFRNTERIENTIDTARIWHGIFFNILKEYNEEISSHYHNQHNKQSFSISPILSENKSTKGYFHKYSLLKVKIALFDNEINKGLLNFIKKNTKVKYEYGELLITEVKYQSIDEIFLDENRIKKGIMKFITPTVFRVNPVNSPLPNPRRIFKSLNKSYNEIFKCEFLQEEVINEIEKFVVVEGFNINTEVAKYKKFNITGFKGNVNLNLRYPDELIQRKLQMLFALANYIGIGYKTGMGMGQCIVLKK